MHTTIGRTARVRRSVLAATGVLAVVTMATACGGDGDGTSEVASLGTSAASDDDGDDATESTVDREDAMLEYAECMRDNGIDMPDPKFDENGGAMIHKSSNGDGAPQSSAAESPEVEGPDFMDDPGFEEADEECAGDLGMKMRPSHQVSELGEGGD